jgi:glycine/D-amino acid oxidase-like deaminating enzyme
MSSAARTLTTPFPLDPPAGVVSARALLDGIARGEPLPPGQVAVVVCAGALGLSCARALKARGLEVTLICRGEPHPAGPCEASRVAATEGLVVEPAARPIEVIRRGGRARWLRLSRGGDEDGFVLPADLVVIDG